jgi:hypothetical protein
MAAPVFPAETKALDSRNEGPRLAAPHQVHRQADGGFLLLPHRLGGQFVHGHHFLGVFHRNGQTLGIVLLELGADDLAVPDEDDGMTVLPGRFHGSLDYDKGSQVAPHRINGN